MRLGLRRGRFAVELLLLGSIASGCSSPPGYSGPLIRAVGDHSSFVFGQVPNVKPGVAMLMPLDSLCTSTGQPVAIDKVTAWRPSGGLHIVDWGTRFLSPTTVFPQIPGAVAIPVRHIGGVGHHPVRGRCGLTDTATEFAVNVAATGHRGAMAGVTVHYAGGEVNVQFAFVLCAGPDSSCAPVPTH